MESYEVMRFYFPKPFSFLRSGLPFNRLRLISSTDVIGAIGGR
jgi:hypothetical protein